MTSLIEPPHFELTRRFKRLYARYQRSRDLISVGAYAAGADPLLDEAVHLYPRLEAFLVQDMHDRQGYSASIAALNDVFA
jgi:flagellum-specific ATP synthase